MSEVLRIEGGCWCDLTLLGTRGIFFHMYAAQDYMGRRRVEGPGKRLRLGMVGNVNGIFVEWACQLDITKFLLC